LRDLNDWRRIRDDLQGTAMNDMFGVWPTVVFKTSRQQVRVQANAAI
jgi:hypothetical protein